MRILHTADWHIGRTLHGKRRHDEHAAFFEWLLRTIEGETVEVLLMAGDVFDTGTPGTQSQELYYRFLSRVGHLGSCRHVVMIAGNHDAPSLIDAPRELLKTLRVHVVGTASEDPEDEVLVLHAPDGSAELIVCAVPYLRDRDVRLVEAGESFEDKGAKLIAGIRDHYAAVATCAELKRQQLGESIPVVAMGHLFTTGGQTVDGDGVRELYVGSLAHVAADTFPAAFDYVALGHLHVPQVVGGQERIRYSGSPIPMGFGEANQQKKVIVVDFDGRQGSIRQIAVPVFRPLARVEGDLPEIQSKLQHLVKTDTSCWVEVTYTGRELCGDLRECVESIVAGSQVEVLRIKNKLVFDAVMKRARTEESLEDLDENEVFERCLQAHEIPETQRDELRLLYQEAVSRVHDSFSATDPIDSIT